MVKRPRPTNEVVRSLQVPVLLRNEAVEGSDSQGGQYVSPQGRLEYLETVWGRGATASRGQRPGKLLKGLQRTGQAPPPPLPPTRNYLTPKVEQAWSGHLREID